MNRISRVAFVGAALVFSAVAFARTDPNSFLNKPANTLPELLSQIDKDEQVSSRYMRHFGQSKEQVIDSFAKLKLGRLPSDGVYLVYNVPNWEEVRARALFFRKGTLVWTDQDGTPVMKVSCGNPMVRGTDIGLAAPMPGVNITPVAEVRDLVALQTPETSFVESVPVIATPGTVDVNAADVLPTTPDLPPVSRPAVVPGLIIPLTAGLLLGLNRGNTPPPVPEPCSLVALGVGAVAIVVRKRRNR
jgi:hypothetical protein